MTEIDPKLLNYATPRQAEILRAYMEHGSGGKAAAVLGVDKSLVHATLKAVKKKAAQQGYAPGHWDSGTAPGYHMGKVTVQRGPEGVERNWERQLPDGDAPIPEIPEGHLLGRITVQRGGSGIERTWEQYNPADASRVDEVLTLLDRRVEGIAPLAPVALPDTLGPAQMLNQVTIADGHVGAHAWHAETGSGNWDLRIARETLLNGACWLMDALPPAQDLLLMVLGDFLDSDGYAPLTPASKHLLDVDGRFPKIADVGADVIEAAVLHGLKRYRNVRLVIKPGNHDPLSAWWMRKLFSRIFQDEPRVLVEQSIRPYWGMLFGKTMISSHHGDKVGLNELPGVFAADFAEMWGQATYRVCHTGHLHHKHFIIHQGKELRGMMVLQHPTLAARNAWAADKGLAAARELLGHSYHVNGAMVTTLHFTEELARAA